MSTNNVVCWSTAVGALLTSRLATSSNRSMHAWCKHVFPCTSARSIEAPFCRNTSEKLSKSRLRMQSTAHISSSSWPPGDNPKELHRRDRCLKGRFDRVIHPMKIPVLLHARSMRPTRKRKLTNERTICFWAGYGRHERSHFHVVQRVDVRSRLYQHFHLKN